MSTTELPEALPPEELPDAALEVEPALIQRQRDLLHELIQLAADRAQAETDAAAGFLARNEAAEKRYQEDRQRLLEQFQRETEETDSRFRETRETIAKRFETDLATAEKEYSDNSRGISTTYFADRESAKVEHGEATWETASMLEACKTKADDAVRQSKVDVEAYQQKIDAISEQTEIICTPWLGERQALPEGPGRFSGPYQKLSSRLSERIKTANRYLAEMRELPVLKYLQGKVVYSAVGALCVLAIVPAAVVSSDNRAYALAGGMVVAAVLGLVTYAWLTQVAKRQLIRLEVPLREAIAEAVSLRRACIRAAKNANKREHARGQEKHDATLAKLKKEYEEKLVELEARRERLTRENEEHYQRRVVEINQTRDRDSAQAQEMFPRRLAELKSQYEADDAAVTDRYAHELEESTQLRDADWEAMALAWREGLERARVAAAAINAEAAALFPDWSEPLWKNWQPPTTIPPVLRFGDFEVRLDGIPSGVSDDPRLQGVGPEAFPLPALIPLAQRGSLLLEAGAEGRTEAEQALQLVMFRLLTAIPPAKVRFTIVDPVGLGQNFAAFMHLADDDEQLVSSRIWTEAPHIEQRLADLTGHMENVIQKCLRNQFRNIEEYNAVAGEVAEPLRFLVVANFPANFSLEATRRLISIAASGARCGVHTLVTIDTRLPMPQGFHLEDLEQHGINLIWEDGRFAWQDADFSPFPFRLDAPPDAGFMTELLQRIGRLAKEASRVEVPFSWIAPQPEEWWTSDSRESFKVALGRVGATRRQYMNLGHGTSQHVLIAGKTGSGKSTLLHALITNTAMHYSPQEVELYLVDFKEGVEFKHYATYELPHARVVAIESEREFGLSVLQRLDAELKVRGEKFRTLGVQDLAGYRQASGEVMPRILLVVDEFQLFFVDDDKIAQDASLLLDRLVRQGRAFGIHVLLGSQTLGGAYSLARSTIGQMAVRVALQCSETDAHMILADDNPAARLLTRPGEAIYNDANGMIEGNDFFQVVWLPEEEREDYLRRVHQMAVERNALPRVPQIVFEGKAPADIRKNYLLAQLLESPSWQAQPRGYRAWLGEAMAIKDPTAAEFRPQSGANVLIVGQYDESALATVTMSLVSLATQLRPPTPDHPAGSRFYVLDGSQPDAPNADYLTKLPQFLPQPTTVASWRDLPKIMEEVSAEVARRQEARDSEAAPVFLFIYALQRFRELRKVEDDYGFSRKGEEKPNPGKQFIGILKDGPAVGVHVIVWCDSLNNVNRAFERSSLREFEMRVLFQMSASDSSALIDAPVASKLGVHRAFYYSEERGQPEKFRPYALPTEEWLSQVKQQLCGRMPSPNGAAAPAAAPTAPANPGT